VQYPHESRRSRKGLFLTSSLAAVLLSAGISRAAIIEYKFDTASGASPPTTPSTGTDTTAAQLNVGALGADGSGVSGMSGDRAFVNVTGGRVNHAADDNSIDALVSFTYSGWLKSNTATPLGSGRIMENSNTPLIQLTGAGDFQLQVNGNTTGFTANSGAKYTDTQKWFFFAITYDGTSSANNVNFYKGYRNAAEAGGDPSVQLVATGTIDKGTENQDTVALNILNRSTGDRTLDTALDNFRIDGTQTGGSSAGALTLTQLEAYRQLDIVPEPGTVGLICAISVTGLLRRRRFAAQ